MIITQRGAKMRSFKFYVFTIILSLLGTHSFGQITIDGTVTDSELNPISNALVEIIDETDTNNIYSDVTDDSGNFSISNITDIEGRPTIVPTDHIVLRNYPNPFNPTTMIYFELPKAENIEIKIYDILGREVRKLYNNFKKAGVYHMTWDGRNNFGSGVATGIYFCRLKTKDLFKVHKMVLLDGGRHLQAPSINLNQSTKNATQIKKAYNNFSFTFRVSGETIISTEFSHIVCTRDTSITLIISKILKAQIIGPMGGVVELDNFSMNIPEGAFDSDFELKLFEKDANEWDNDNVSKIIGVDGLPLKINFPLNIAIVPVEQLTDESYITIGQDYELPFTNTSEIVYNFMETKDSLGILKCELPISSSPSENKMTKSSSSNYKQHKTYFTAKTGFSSQLSYNKHFKIFDKKYEYWLIKQIGNTLEWNYNLLRDEGFDTTSVNWPVEVYVKKLNPNIEKRGCIYYPTFGLKNMSLLIDQDRINNIMYSSLRECAVGILRTYDQDFFLPNEFTGKVDPSRYWFHHATASWFEEKKHKQWPDDFPYFPIDFQNSTILHVFNEGSGDNRLAPFSGMLAGAGTTSLSALKHGGGMSSFIKYIDVNYGTDLILLIYDQIKGNRLKPIEAIKNFMADSYLWWPDYLENYIESNIYESFDKEGAFNPYDEPKPLHDIIAGEHTFENKSDTLKSFKDIKYHPLSAKVYKIGWSPNAFDTLRVLRISTTDLNNNTLFVYGDFGNNYFLLGKGESFLMSIKELLSTQFSNSNIRNLRVVVTNSECSPPYNNLTNINLELKLEKPKEIKFNACKIETRVMGIWERHRIPPPPNTSPTIDTMGYLAEWNTIGNFTGTTFEGVLEPNDYGADATGTVKLELDDQLNISSFSVEAKSHYDDENSQWECAGANIALQNNTDWNMNFDVVGESTFNNLTNLYYYHESPPSNTGVVPYSKLIDYFCDENSYIKVTFYKKSIP